jgi:hypothetical protein
MADASGFVNILVFPRLLADRRAPTSSTGAQSADCVLPDGL